LADVDRSPLPRRAETFTLRPPRTGASSNERAVVTGRTSHADTTQPSPCVHRSRSEHEERSHARLDRRQPDRIVWGCDWPHPNSVTPPGQKVSDVTPLFQIDDGRLLNQLPVWAPDATVRKPSWWTIRRGCIDSDSWRRRRVTSMLQVCSLCG